MLDLLTNIVLVLLTLIGMLAVLRWTYKGWRKGYAIWKSRRTGFYIQIVVRYSMWWWVFHPLCDIYWTINWLGYFLTYFMGYIYCYEWALKSTDREAYIQHKIECPDGPWFNSHSPSWGGGYR